ITAVIAVFYLVWVALAVATPALMLEKQPVLKAIGRSWRLVRGSRWRVFFVNLLAFIITFVIANIVAAPFQLFGGGFESFLDPAAASEPTLLELIIVSLGGVIGSMITLPFSAAITVLLYVDLRIRREGMDIELARAAGVTLPGAPQTAPTAQAAPQPGAQPGAPQPGPPTNG
ncbi:MAG: glycerophosphoryl diester phosphodiesterase membrane domain-containing protein, partial [Sporichthyaceae bacterium]|nr:glycerophosphoryl diester phosphodiesterase membrane domain-containing protein [Sporichthyaceae bacterium]